MDERYCNEINKRIISGNLPAVRLCPVPFNKEQRSDLDAGLASLTEADDALTYYIKFIHSFLSVVCSSAGIDINDIDEFQKQTVYTKEVSLILNTGYSSTALSHRGKAYKASSNLCPYVTPLDKGLTFAGFIKNENGWNHALALRIYITQVKELLTKNTIDIDKIDMSTSILALLSDPWTDPQNHFLRKITPQEKEDLNSLLGERNRIRSLAQSERLEAEKIAEKTDRDWGLFLEIIFDLYQKEEQIIKTILDDTLLAKEKLDSIKEFDRIVQNLKNQKAIVRGEHVDFKRILGSVIDRFNGTPDLSLVQVENGQPFGINNEILYIVTQYCTFNRFQIKYHQFRLDPENENLAIEFFSLACECIQKHLGIPKKEAISTDGKPLYDLVILFYNTVNNYFDQHKDSVRNLRFSHLQPDTIAASHHAIEKSWVARGEELIFQHDKDLQTTFINALEDSYQSLVPPNDSVEPDLERINQVLVGAITQTIPNAVAEASEFDDQLSEAKEESEANQIVSGINVIYLFRAALDTVLEKPEKYSIGSDTNTQQLKQISEALKRREEKIIKTWVYSEIDEYHLDAEDMDSHRKKTGIDASSLVKRETELASSEKNLAIENVFVTFRDKLQRMFCRVNERDIKGLLEEKQSLYEDLFCFDHSGSIKPYVDKIDEISNLLCSLLVKACRQDGKKFEEIRKNLCVSLGPESVRLPKSSIDTLATAEMLYKEYANEELAVQGFDFSGISTLYFQAFETAYNELIWQDYEKELTDILARATDKSLYTKMLDGYLPDSGIREQYVDCEKKPPKKQIKQIKHTIMYKSFGNLLKHSIQQKSSTIRNFCDYFVHKVGFFSRDNMYNDADFMRNIGGFVDVVLSAAENRNNASHGGRIISFEQLNEDKKTVLSDLEAVRSDSIGLIQKLLFLLSYNSKPE